MSEWLLRDGCVDRSRDSAYFEQRPPAKVKFWRVIDHHRNDGAVRNAPFLKRNGQSSYFRSELAVRPATIFEKECFVVFVLSICLMEDVVERPVVFAAEIVGYIK